MTKISFSVLYGGPDSEIIESIFRNFKNHIRQLVKSYSTSIEEIKITLCVAGSIHNYNGKIGIDQFRYEKKLKRVNIILVRPKKTWSQGNKEVVRFFREMVTEATQSLSSTCKKTIFISISKNSKKI